MLGLADQSAEQLIQSNPTMHGFSVSVLVFVALSLLLSIPAPVVASMDSERTMQIYKVL